MILTGETEVLGENPLPVPPFPPQMSHPMNCMYPIAHSLTLSKTWLLMVGNTYHIAEFVTGWGIRILHTEALRPKK
jgi:hypothetical protein